MQLGRAQGRCSPSTSDRGGRFGEAGMTLIEVIGAMFVAFTTLVAIAAAVLAIFYSARANRQTVRAGIEATNVAERISSAMYVPCASMSTYGAALVTVDGYVPTITKVEYLVDKNAATPTFHTGSCTNDQGVQRITVRVSNVDRVAASEDLVYLKRDTRCSGSPLGVQC